MLSYKNTPRLLEDDMICTAVACGNRVRQTKIVQESTKVYHRCINHSCRKIGVKLNKAFHLGRE